VGDKILVDQTCCQFPPSLSVFQGKFRGNFVIFIQKIQGRSKHSGLEASLANFLGHIQFSSDGWDMWAVPKTGDF
jgi:hypothetical protein